jgi:hypothetical protein
VSPPEDKFTPWAFRQSLRGMKLTGAQYRIAIELAEHTKSGKPAVWPSIATLARHCAMNTRTVERALGELANLGIITKGDGKSTRILAIQPPVHRPVASGLQTGHTPVHRPDEYPKYENKGPKTDDDGSSGSWDDKDSTTSEANHGLASSEVSATGVAGLGNDCDPMDRMQNVPPNCLDKPSNICPNCGCDENDPWGTHTRKCPDNYENFLKY